MKRIISFVMVFFLCFCICSCADKTEEVNVWENATYTEDTEIGTGDKTVLVEVVAKDKSVTFTIHSDKNNLGNLLLEHKIVEGEKGPYGLYVKKVNGITADYDVNRCYWGVNKNGDSAATGIDGIEFKDGEHYELVYTSVNN